MEALFIIGIIIQAILALQFLLPPILFVLSVFKRKKRDRHVYTIAFDYAIILTAYEQTDQLPAVVKSILEINYDNYLIYVVADNCDISSLKLNNDKVVLLRPPKTLASNIKSHFYAIARFKRPHELLTIIDSDNLVDS